MGGCRALDMGVDWAHGRIRIKEFLISICDDVVGVAAPFGPSGLGEKIRIYETNVVGGC